MSEFAGKRVLVMGLGRFGGGLGVTRYLAAEGARVVVTDLLPASELAEPVAELGEFVSAGSVELRLGGHDKRNFDAADVVVANPAIRTPWRDPFLERVRARGGRITTEIELVVSRLACRDRVVGVTGTVGKSTTAAMIARGLEASGCRVHLGGNIGGSLLGTTIGDDDFVVLELSSAMLWWLPAWSPGVAVLTNIAPNHLDWHETQEHYIESKLKLFDHQRDGDGRVLGSAELHSVVGFTSRRVRERIVNGADVERRRSDGTFPAMLAPGAHNAINAMVAAEATALVTLGGVTTDAALERIATFPGLPHRLELVREVKGVRYYNDSKSTSPEATIRAIEAVGPARRVHLIAGGYDKGVDLGPLVQAARGCKRVYTIGATGEKLAAGANCETAGSLGSRHCGTLPAAMAAVSPEPDDVVLLSPGCASWDQFTNFESRGAAFRALVEALE